MRNPCFPIVERVPRDFDPWLATIRLLPAAIKTARQMRWFSKHYREATGEGTFVGGAGIGSAPEAIGIFSGANQNLAPGDNPTKICAEPIALQKMVHYYGQETPKLLTAMVVAATVQADKHSKIRTLATQTCGLERDELYPKLDIHFEEEGFIHEDSIMFHVRPHEDIFEVDSHYGLLSAHALKEEDEIQTYYDPGFQALQVADVAYIGAVNESLAAGFEPDRGALALSAITGQLPLVIPLRPQRLDRQQLLAA